ncbi:Peptidoglycan glycosyltransferase MrdB [Halomicronema hongdechloris C2206]|uniref:Peptidoglycan glycosyltransferase RodA n=1 Tax=Halomicronema hongdechloris C2206 TaxID=1641165 RepID=A0A1Z3HK73_9CYAN|nr:rod shape-determining protein RodA [Halomicronema hongdechloris]ASC70685.1 Peptidoglycan glycosyltransferase MrdB [Halomicronema hongdechloris C2206]
MNRSLVWRQRWKLLSQGWQEIDWLLLGLPAMLTVFGSLVITSTQHNLDTNYGQNHLLLGGICLVITLWLARCRYEGLHQWRWWIYAATNASLLAVMFIGTVGSGAQRWIPIAGFHVQPSEFAKLGMIITLAALLSQRGASTLWGMTKALGITAVPWVLVFLQPDLGTSLVFGAITLGMLYWANINPGWLVLLISPLMAAIVFHLFLPGWLVWVGLMGLIAWQTLPFRLLSTITVTAINLVSGKLGELLWGLLKDYQKSRLVLFLNPDQDPLGGGYHLIQSRIAIGAGEAFGRGLGQGTQTQLNFIPEQHTDFIFSAIGEELGFLGAMVVVVVFWLICLRLVIIAQNAKDNFGSLLAIGVLMMIVFQVLVNIGMTIGLAPVTGIPLPWISYGRSALLTNFIALGLVESVANYRHRLKFTK